MRSLILFLSRTVLGGYLFVHGAQKLGFFGGHGLDATAGHFESIGLSPGKQMALLDAGMEMGGGLLTATGIAYPLGPIAIAGTMLVAASTHRANGPMAANRGFELPLTNAAAAAALAVAGPGRIRLGPRLSRPLAILAALGATGSAAALVAKVLTAQPALPPAGGEQSASEPSAAPASEPASQPAS